MKWLDEAGMPRATNSEWNKMFVPNDIVIYKENPQYEYIVEKVLPWGGLAITNMRTGEFKVVNSDMVELYPY